MYVYMIITYIYIYILSAFAQSECAARYPRDPVATPFNP